MGHIGPTKHRLLQHVSSPMPGHLCEGLGREGVTESFCALFRWQGVLNGLGSCGILVELRIGLTGQESGVRPATKSLY